MQLPAVPVRLRAQPRSGRDLKNNPVMPGSNGSFGGAGADAASAELVQEYGRRLGRDTIVYASGTAAVLVVSLATLTIFTHYMTPAQYGSLAILFFFAGALTIILNLIPLAGILRWVYVSGEADAGAIDDPSRQAPGGTKRRALGTGCWMNLASIAVCSAVLIPFRSPLAQWLLGSSSTKASNQVLLAIASGAAGSVFRVTSNVVRMERRPVAFSMIAAARPFVALAVATPLVVEGNGIDGALIGTIVGSIVPALVAFAIVRRAYSAQFNWTDAREITNLGSRYTFVILGLFVVHNGDAFVLSRYATHAAVGIYRVATRLSSIISYLVSAFLLAWAPLERSALFQATYEAHGESRMHSRMLTYFVVAGLTITLGLSLAGDLIVQLSPPAYRSAANLIPWTSFAFVIYGMYVIIARTTAYRRRDIVHNGSAALAAILYLALSALLVPRWGGYGVAAASAIGMGIACACFRAIVPWATRYARMEVLRLLGATVITFACLLLGRVPHQELVRIAFGVADFFLIYPAALILSRVVPRREAEVIWKILVGIVEQVLSPLRPARSGAPTVAALKRLDPSEVALLRVLVKERTPAPELARRQGVPVSVLSAAAGRALRTLSGADGSERYDAAIGHWLFGTEGSAEQDVVGNFLVDHGLARMTLHRVQAALASLKALPVGLWPYSDDVNGGPPAGGLTVEPSLLEIG